MTLGERNRILIGGKYSGAKAVFLHNQREAGMVYILKDSGILKDIGDFDLSFNCAFPNSRFAGMDSLESKQRSAR